VSRPELIVEIERLVLDGLDVTSTQAEEIRSALEAELGRLLMDRSRDLERTGNDGRDATAIRLTSPLSARALAGDVARRVAQEVPAVNGMEGDQHA
jgi:hypothetical protein